MGDVIISLGSGGGADLDVVTTSAWDVLAGKIFLGTDGEPVAGTMPNMSNDWWTARNSVTLDNGTDAATNGFYGGVPTGYHNESNTRLRIPKANVVSLAGITSDKIRAGANILGVPGDGWTVWTGDVSADDSKVLAGHTYWRYGEKRTGNLSVQSAINFNVAQYSNLTLLGTWALPARGPWSGIRIIANQSRFPNHADDGTLFYEGSASFAIKQLPAGTWYLRAWNYLTTNYGRMYGGSMDSWCSNVTVQGIQTFTASGTFVVPANVRQLTVFCVGGGGNGGEDESNNQGGGGGGYTVTRTIDVSPGQSYWVEVGAGGKRGGTTSGGASRFGGIVTANGGSGGSVNNPAPGGSGGGQRGAGRKNPGGVGGSNGGPGYRSAGSMATWSNGQGTTTYEFGESWRTLYSGGGGGGIDTFTVTSDGGYGGIGGSGGGGNGHRWDAGANAEDGTANTGGGAGGGQYGSRGATGGSGIVIVRWGY